MKHLMWIDEAVLKEAVHRRVWNPVKCLVMMPDGTVKDTTGMGFGELEVLISASTDFYFEKFMNDLHEAEGLLPTTKELVQAKRKKERQCTFCPPHRGENARGYRTHGVRKPRNKDHR